MSLSQSETPKVSQFLLAYSCPMNWEEMDGDDKTRFCNRCSMNVFNISDMSEKEANEIIRKSDSGEQQCIKYYKRADGTIKFDNCPVLLRSVRNRIRWLRRAMSIACSIILSLIGATKGSAESSKQKSVNTNPNIATTKDKAKTKICHLDEHDHGFWLGRPAPSDIRESLNDLFKYCYPGGATNDYFHDDDLRLNALHESVQKTGNINPDELEELRKFYIEKKQYILAYHAACAELLIRFKFQDSNRSLYKDEQIQMQLTRVEDLRQKALTQILDNAQTNPTKNKFWNFEFTKCAISSRSLAERTNKFPAGVRMWKLTCGEVIATEALLRRYLKMVEQQKNSDDTTRGIRSALDPKRAD